MLEEGCVYLLASQFTNTLFDKVAVEKGAFYDEMASFDYSSLYELKCPYIFLFTYLLII